MSFSNEKYGIHNLFHTCKPFGNARPFGIFGEPYLVTNFSVQFKEMYLSLHSCFFSYCILKTFQKFVRHLNTYAFLLLHEQMQDPSSTVLPLFQNFKECTLQTLLKFRSCPQSTEKFLASDFTIYLIFFNNPWTNCRLKLTRFRCIFNRPRLH